MLNNIDIPKIDIPNNLKIKINEIKKQKQNENEFNQTLIEYQLRNANNICYNNECCKCFNMFGWCL